jgi:hypothetical protein
MQTHQTDSILHLTCNRRSNAPQIKPLHAKKRSPNAIQ